MAILSTLSCWTGIAAASPDYPSVVKAHLPMPCTPDCTICHRDSPGVGGTAVKPFVLTLSSRGLTSGGNPQALIAALESIKATPTDSDLDGVFDHVELNRPLLMPVSTGQDTTDPNSPEGIDTPSANVCPPEPVYGCGGAHITRRPHGHSEYLLLGLLGSVLAAGVGRRLTRRRAG